jgi:hypothetical protein
MRVYEVMKGLFTTNNQSNKGLSALILEGWNPGMDL